MAARELIQVVNLELKLCLSPGFEPQGGRTFDLVCENMNQKVFNSRERPAGWVSTIRCESTREETPEIFSR